MSNGNGLITDKHPVARKSHSCDICHTNIEPGTRYRRSLISWEGSIATFIEHEEWCAFRESVIGGGDAPCDCGVDLTQAHRAGRAEGEKAATNRIADELAAHARHQGSKWWEGLADNLKRYGTINPSIEQVYEEASDAG